MATKQTHMYGCPCGKKFADVGHKDQHMAATGHGADAGFDINDATRKFHDSYAALDDHRGTPEYIAFEDVSRKIINKFKTEPLKSQFKVKRMEFVGSVWEKTRIAKHSDFDALLIIEDSCIEVDRVGTVAAPNGYVAMKKSGTQYTPQDMMKKIYGAMQGMVNLPYYFGDFGIQLRAHGPAVQVDVSAARDSGPLLASIDLVPTIEDKEKQYVGKPPSYGISCDPESLNSFWRKSHSLEAKSKLVNIDRGSTCRREVYRVCKVLRNREPTLHPITSYYLKSTLFRVTDRLDVDWSRDKIGDRLLDVLGLLRDSYKTGSLPDYFEPDINLIHTINGKAKENVADRLTRLVKQPEKLFK